MHFVFVSTMAGAPWGGSEELWSRAAVQLREEGHQVSAFVIWWPEPSPKVLELRKRGVHVCFTEKPPTLLGRAWNRAVGDSWRREKVVQWLRKHTPDLVVISQGGNADGREWMSACRAASVPFAPIVQCNSEHWWPGDELGTEMAQAYQAARRVFCVSRANLELLECQIGESLQQAEIVRNPFNVSVGPPPAWPAQNGNCTLACVARLEPAAKGQDLLLQVFSQPKWRERPVKISFYGAGPCEGNLKRLAQAFRLHHVHFCGHVANIHDIWAENQMLVLPSRYEGLPLALVESMWSARPAVVTDVGGNAELCEDEVTGFVASAPALQPLDDALERAWNRQSDWEGMGSAARTRVEQLVPKEPVSHFCAKLMECVSGIQVKPAKPASTSNDLLSRR